MFRVPNVVGAPEDAAPTDSVQAGAFSGWVTDLARRPTGVVEGGAVTSSGASDRKANVAAGVARISGVTVVFGAGDVTLAAADPTHPRIDAVSVTSTGTLAVTTGVAAASPVEPTVPDTRVKLAAVLVPGGAGGSFTVSADWISDRRLPVSLPRRGRWSPAGFTPLVDEVIQFLWCDPNRIYWLLASPPVAATAGAWRACIQVISAGSGTARLALYDVDRLGTPTSLIDNFGDATVSVSTTGVKVWTPSSSTTLEPDRTYAFGVMTNVTAQIVALDVNNGTPLTTANVYPTNRRSQIRTGTFTFGSWPGTAPSVELVDNAFTPNVVLRAP